VEHLHIGMEVI